MQEESFSDNSSNMSNLFIILLQVVIKIEKGFVGWKALGTGVAFASDGGGEIVWRQKCW